MPRAPKVCTTQDCSEAAVVGRTRCRGHEQKAEQRRGNPHQRGYDNRWRQFRYQYLKSNPICVDCSRIATDVDHIDGEGPLSPRGYDETNLQALCHPCHSRKTARTQPAGWNWQPETD